MIVCKQSRLIGLDHVICINLLTAAPLVAPHFLLNGWIDGAPGVCSRNCGLHVPVSLGHLSLVLAKKQLLVCTGAGPRIAIPATVSRLVHFAMVDRWIRFRHLEGQCASEDDCDALVLELVITL